MERRSPQGTVSLSRHLGAAVVSEALLSRRCVSASPPLPRAHGCPSLSGEQPKLSGHGGDSRVMLFCHLGGTQVHAVSDAIFDLIWGYGGVGSCRPKKGAFGGRMEAKLYRSGGAARNSISVSP